MDELWLYKLLSILGALAWLPSIIDWIKKWLTRPRLSIIPDRTVEIGYTANGHVVNVRLAFTTEKKGALIKNVTLSLKHEKHDTHVFQWEWFEEEIMQMETLDTGLIPYKKNQKAIAIKVLVDNLIEKKVGFHETEFKKGYNKKLKQLRDIYHNWMTQNKDLKDLKITNEYTSFQDLIKNSFSWKVGVYTATIKVFTDNLKPAAETTIQFTLTSLDLKNLEHNIAATHQFIENSFVVLDPEYRTNWNWVYTDTHEI
ncbi:MAG TPA: hypothetical protein VKB95_12555 [Chitinophagaceae bacterium]|nr:hypothetical protein [Chitinophagaceae bacterium]